jgi:putative ABC transport system permease protein
VRRLFIWEGALLGLIGAGAGVIAAILIGLLINHSDLSWSPPGQVGRIPLTVRVWGEAAMVGTAAAGLVVVAIISAWWPALRAARKNIVDALRHV